MSNLSQAADVPVQNAGAISNPKLMMAVLWAAAVVALMAPVMSGGVFDAMSTDDAMRLVEVRDLLAGQNWFDLTQHRLDPPGASMHWSRVIDAPLAAMIWMLRSPAGQQGAEAITLVVAPALLLGAALLLVASIARRISQGSKNSSVPLAAVLMATLSVPALIHFRAGAIDHHNAQIVLLLALIALTQKIESSLVEAGLAGFVAALSLAVGLEMLPAIAAICFAIFGIQIWHGPTVSRHIGMFGAAMAGSSLLLAVLLLPLPSLTANVCDAFGGPILLLTAAGGLTLMTVALIDRWRPALPARLVAGALAGVAVLGLFFRLFPGCLASPYAQVDPLVTSVWLDHVFETMSFLTVLLYSPQKVLGIYGFPLVALVAAATALVRCAPATRSRWIIAIAALAALIATSMWEMRAAAAATMVAAPILAASLAQLWPAHAQGRKLLVAALALSPATLAIAGFAARPLSEMLAQPQWTIVERNAAASCRTVSIVAPLASLPRGRIMAPIDLGPEILAATPHAVFAAPYHRNNDGNLAMLHLMMAAPLAARQMLSDRGVDYVVLCRNGTDQVEFEKLAPDGLAARLSRGTPADFLEPVDIDPTGRLAVWRARR